MDTHTSPRLSATATTSHQHFRLNLVTLTIPPLRERREDPTAHRAVYLRDGTWHTADVVKCTLILLTLTSAAAGCSTDGCTDPCPDGSTCVADRCRIACSTNDTCASGKLCFRGYCEEGDLPPSGVDGDSITVGDSMTVGDPATEGDPGPAYCGNNNVEGDETCDGTDLDGFNLCTDFLWAGGGPVTCMPTCAQWDLSTCTNPPGNCGSGTATGRQQCDTEDLRDESCESLGFSGGILSCNSNCTLDVSGCSL